MKKLLSLSILAATLASTAAFAVPGPSAGDNDNAPVAVQFYQAGNDKDVSTIFGIAQELDNTLVGGGNRVKAMHFMFDQKGSWDQSDLALAKAITEAQENTIVEAFAASARFANGKNPGSVDVEPGNGLTFLKVTVLEQTQQPKGHTYAFVLNQARTTVTVSEVKTDEVRVAKLEKQRSNTKLVAAVASF